MFRIPDSISSTLFGYIFTLSNLKFNFSFYHLSFTFLFFFSLPPSQISPSNDITIPYFSPPRGAGLFSSVFFKSEISFEELFIIFRCICVNMLLVVSGIFLFRARPVLVNILFIYKYVGNNQAHHLCLQTGFDWSE
jgi:hypothetical protein